MVDRNVRLTPAIDILLRQHPELDSGGSGITIIDGEYDPRKIRLPDGHDGYVGEVPEGFNVRYLGHGLVAGVDPYDEFVFWDPLKWDVRIEPFHVVQGSGFDVELVRAARELEIERQFNDLHGKGFQIERRYYPNDGEAGMVILFGKKQRFNSASPVGRTSRLAQQPR